MSFRELSALLEEISGALDDGGKEFIGLSDELVIISIRLREAVKDHQDIARGTKVKND